MIHFLCLDKLVKRDGNVSSDTGLNALIAVCRGVRFVVKVSCSYVVRGERGVLFLFPAKRPPRKIVLSGYTRRASQRRCFQRICLADSYRGRPSLRSGSRSEQKKHSPFAPSYGLCNRRELVAPVTRTSMYLLLVTTKIPSYTDIA